MPTDLDDDMLTRELSTAFHSTAADLRYTGRRRPPRQPIAALPAIGAVATIGAVVMVATQSGTSHDDKSPALGGPTTQVTHQPGAAHPHGTQTIKLAGFEISYRATAGGGVGAVKLTLGPLPDHGGQTVALSVRLVDAVPDGAQSVPVPDSDAQAWVGKDPATGDNGLYLKAPTRAGGQLFVVGGPGWTTHELTNLVQNGSPFN
jgi:hypothetical protein